MPRRPTASRCRGANGSSTNGLGGYASGTVAGVVTRRYHGLLVASLPAPLGRVVMLNHLLERVRLPTRGVAVARRRGRSRGPERGGPSRPPRRVPARARAAGLAVRDRRLRDREARADAARPEHRPRDLPAARGRGAGAARRCGRRSSSAATKRRSTQSPVPDLQPDGDPAAATSCRGGADFPCLRMALHGQHAALTLDEKGVSAVPYEMEQHRGYAVGRLAVEPRLLPRRSDAGRERHAGRVDRVVGSRSRRSRRRLRRAAEAERRRGLLGDRRDRRATILRRASSCWRPTSSSSRPPAAPRKRRARARRARRCAPSSPATTGSPTGAATR